VIAAVPGWERLAVSVLLTPLRGRGVKLRAESRRPVFIEGLQFDDGGGADIADVQPNAFVFCASKIGFNGFALFAEFFRGRQTTVSEPAHSTDVNNICAAGGCGFSLVGKSAEVVEGMAGDANLKFGGRGSG